MRLLGNVTFLLLLGTALMGQDSMPAKPVICYYTEEDSFTEILTDYSKLSNARIASTASIEVTFVDFPEQAKTAFNQAVNIWSKYLISSQTIRIKATWSSLAAGTLAVSGATRIYKNFTNVPYTNVWYPVPLAEALAGRDLNAGDTDITVTVNSNINWYYGTDGKAQSGRYDMITIVLHEIAHGLGFSTSVELVNSDTQAQYGQSGSAYIYDTFIQDNNKIKITNTGVYGNPSTDLKNAVTSNALYFGLKNPKLATALPRLYAPTSFKPGSSLSHFDESTYPQGNPNSLMSPSIKAAEVNQDPGELLLNCLSELGWQLNNFVGYVINGTESLPEEVLEVKVFPNPVANELTIAFPLQSQPRNIRVQLVNALGSQLQLIERQSIIVETVYLDVSNLGEGIYFLKIVDGEKVISKKIVK